VSVETLRRQTARFIRQHQHHWRQEVRERGAEVALTAAVLERLAGLALIEFSAEGVRARPALARFALRGNAELAPAGEPPELPLEP